MTEKSVEKHDLGYTLIHSENLKIGWLSIAKKSEFHMIYEFLPQCNI